MEFYSLAKSIAYLKEHHSKFSFPDFVKLTTEEKITPSFYYEGLLRCTAIQHSDGEDGNGGAGREVLIKKFSPVGYVNFRGYLTPYDTSIVKKLLSGSVSIMKIHEVKIVEGTPEFSIGNISVGGLNLSGDGDISGWDEFFSQENYDDNGYMMYEEGFDEIIFTIDSSTEFQTLRSVDIEHYRKVTKSFASDNRHIKHQDSGFIFLPTYETVDELQLLKLDKDKLYFSQRELNKLIEQPKPKASDKVDDHAYKLIIGAMLECLTTWDKRHRLNQNTLITEIDSRFKHKILGCSSSNLQKKFAEINTLFKQTKTDS